MVSPVSKIINSLEATIESVQHMTVYAVTLGMDNLYQNLCESM